jgi:fermentation-respiration switch protein FrsA (DUF1100 family)
MHPRAAGLPSALRAGARWRRLGPAGIPVMLAHPSWDSGQAVPLVIWLHGRTAHKELDPGRYLRWLRAGLGVCAVDLPGHGERPEPLLQEARGSLRVIVQMMQEIDEVLGAAAELGPFDLARLGIGGMSAGGMAVLARLCRPHSFRCATVEAATGSWRHQRQRQMFDGISDAEVAALDPLRHLDGWREIPFQAFHSEVDEAVAFAGQREFVDALRARYQAPDLIELVHFERTGAPLEHLGFGRLSAQVKDAQARFLRRWLLEQAPAAAAP